jgi:hypothetical protein
MKIKTNLTLLIIVLLHVFAGSLCAQQPLQDPLNEIKIGSCTPTNPLDDLIKAERKRGLVIDVRPFAVNQSTGKLTFNGKTGRVSVVHMNPFIYNYNISIAQQELTSSAVTDFLEILLPPGLRLGSKAQAAAAQGSSDEETLNGLSMIATRLKSFKPENCRNSQDPGCAALGAMKTAFDNIQGRLKDTAFEKTIERLSADVGEYKVVLTPLLNEEADAVTNCNNATSVNAKLTTLNPASSLGELDAARQAFADIHTLTKDLSDLVDEYFKDDGLKNYVVRCEGFNCASQFKAYALAVDEVLEGYSKDRAQFAETFQAMKRMYDLTNQMKTKEGVFARSFEIIKKFEMSEATVTVARVKIEPKPKKSEDEAEEEEARGSRMQSRHHSPLGAAASDGSTRAEDPDPDDDKEKGEKKADAQKGNTAVPGQINESIQLGRPRFLLSGGLVFSPLRRRTFENVKGFVRDANGNPIGDGDKDVVGFGENSPRRLLPMAILNTRLASFKPTSFYFSLGVTAKHDDNVDVEYLLGPSVSLLNERALFTFGAYAGKVQNLVPDVKVGDEIPESVGDAKLFAKRNSWKPGFSFSYVFSQNKSSGETGGGSGATSGTADLKNELRIGGVPFNLALGLAYTSLEERTHDEIVGFARDRQGNLTNGQNLTRIVGLTSSSGYRLAPIALLHSRLINFGSHSFYFSTGVTGKKSDDNLQLEYLLGGSVNVYRRKVFLTFGAFAGKQQSLGGDFFLGAKLDQSQNVTTETRYVWKPGFAISYDISKILPKGSN